MKILFICKHNVFRSKIAEEYFNKVNENKGIKAFSRGLVMGAYSDIEQRKVAKELLGINIAKRNGLSVKRQDLKDADKIIVVADDIPRVLFNYQNFNLQPKVEIWGIHDEQKGNKSNIRKIILQIKEKVDALNKRLNK